MPLKDPVARAAYAKAQYQRNKSRQMALTKDRRLRLAAEKRAAAIGPKLPKTRTCKVCGCDITFTYKTKLGEKCASCNAAYMAAYRESNKERIARLKKLWVQENFEKKAAQDKDLAAKNPEARRLARQKWANANPGKNNAAKRANKIARDKRVPTWLSEEDKWMIAQAYEIAAVRTNKFGFPWHVDHIIPLSGKLVSGLHVPNNLQVIPYIENLRKLNRYEVAA